ncbi:MAG: glycosyl transferase family 2, partial [Bacteroidota bacterium]
AGLFDEDFFMYGEDLDWCFRIKEAGWKIYYTPDTQIIHYKGESTKKGELRYVRLFYGAMAQFVQKHFHDRYSRLFAGMLHVGIGVRATQTVLGNWAKRVRQPLAEWVLAFAVLCVVAKVRSLPVNFSFSPFFYYAVAPIYALVITTSIGLFGGYRSRRRRRVRPAVLGVTWAFLATVVASFFVKSVAFSRIVVLVGYALAGVGIVVLRFVLAERSERRIGRRQAVVVGPPEEAQAFQNHLVGLRQAPLDVIGFVWDEPLVRAAPVQTVPRLGGLNQIRDIVRLQHVDDLVFPAEGVPNGVVLKLLRELNDLSVDFKMLAEGREHVIGKSYIGALTDGPSVVEAESRIHLPRSRMARRLADVPLALLGGLAGVFVRWPAPQAGTPRARFVELWRHVPSVVTGRRALVGYDPAGSFIPPPEWGIEEGASPILSDAEAVPASRLRDAYWAYTQRQSAWTDLRLVARWIRGDA